MKPKLIQIAQDTNYDEALYVNGKLVKQEITIHACEIAEVAGSDLVIIDFLHVEDSDDEWPEDIQDLVQRMSD